MLTRYNILKFFVLVLIKLLLFVAKLFVFIGETISYGVFRLFALVLSLYELIRSTIASLHKILPYANKLLRTISDILRSFFSYITSRLISYNKKLIRAYRATQTAMSAMGAKIRTSIQNLWRIPKSNEEARLTPNATPLTIKPINVADIATTPAIVALARRAKASLTPYLKKTTKYAMHLASSMRRSATQILSSTVRAYTKTQQLLRKSRHSIVAKIQKDFDEFSSDTRKLYLQLRALPRPKSPTLPTFQTSAKPQKHPQLNATLFVNKKAHKVFVFANFCIGLAVFIATCYLIYRSYSFYQTLPSPKLIGIQNFALTTHITDRNGALLYDFYKDENRTQLKRTDIPKLVVQATIAIEDKEFYKHIGISPLNGILRAIKDWARTGKIQGGSTITQQLVKVSLLTSERTLERKLKEAYLALEVERLYSKDEILTMYLNQVPYGGQAYGIEEASRTFFNKHSRDLSLSEAALLAGLPQAPSQYSPFAYPAEAIARRNLVLQSMLAEGYIDTPAFDEAISQKPVFAKPQVSIVAPHFVFFVKDHLENYLDEDYIAKAGLNIRTTLDLQIQNAAQKILVEELEKVKPLGIGNGGVMVVDPKNGQILAMVGSKGYFDNAKWGEYNVTTAMRQPGSTLKPLLYLQALAHGYAANTQIADTPTNFAAPGSREAYRPVNYDGRFRGAVTMRQALANSYNIPAVKTLQKLGVGEFISFLRTLGVTSLGDPQNYGLSLSLGGGEVTMLDLGRIYSVLANRGIKSELTPILEIKNSNEKEVILETAPQERVVPEANTYIISDILSDNAARTAAFGPNSELVVGSHRVAVKTGTTNDKKDNWTIGYTPDYLVLVWVGNNDGTPMNPLLTSGVTGAAPIWNRVMKYILDVKNTNYTAWYDKPSTIVEKTCFGTNEKFIAGTQDRNPCAFPTPTRNVAKDDEKKD